MDRKGFALYLKKRGKKPHVEEELVAAVECFENYLSARPGGLSEADAQDLEAYAAKMDSERAGSSRNALRAIALYYRFAANDALADSASAMRERLLEQTRTSLPLREFPGIVPEHIAALESTGIVHAEALLEAGSTAGQRKQLAARCGVPEEIVLELVKLSDLSRLFGVKGVRARLYHDAGVDTLDKLAAEEPESLLRHTSEFVRRTGFNGIAPLPKEVLFTIEAARELPRLVKYEKE